MDAQDRLLLTIAGLAIGAMLVGLTLEQDRQAAQLARAGQLGMRSSLRLAELHGELIMVQTFLRSQGYDGRENDGLSAGGGGLDAAAAAAESE